MLKPQLAEFYPKFILLDGAAISTVLVLDVKNEEAEKQSISGNFVPRATVK